MRAARKNFTTHDHGYPYDEKNSSSVHYLNAGIGPAGDGQVSPPSATGLAWRWRRGFGIWAAHELERYRGQRPERRILIMADQRALKRIGLSLGALAVTVTLIAAAVVTQQTDSQPAVDRAGSMAIVATSLTH
jgi:hypothetical protein